MKINVLPFPLLSAAILSVMLVTSCAGAGNSSPDKPLDPAAEQGKTIFRNFCASCHATIGETVIVGPSLAGIATIAATREEGLTARQYLIVSISKPDAYIVEGFKDVMPSDFGIKMSGEEFDDLVTYLETLK
ncbi:MAG: cytochrome c [Chloroflexi bacterium]|nr:cytochrome c [Chloroflexota bacterium]